LNPKGDDDLVEISAYFIMNEIPYTMTNYECKRKFDVLQLLLFK